jgi:hypothetical protein
MFLLSGLGAAGDVYPRGTQFGLEIRARNIPGSTNAAMASSLLYTGLILKNWTSSGMGSEILHHVKVQTNRDAMSSGLVREVTLNAFRTHGTQIYGAGEAVPLYGARPSGSVTPGSGGGVPPGTPTYPTATACLNRGGTCMDVTECSRLGRTSIVNLCPGTPNNIRCCLPRTAGSPATPRSSGGGGGVEPPLANDPGSQSTPWGTGHYVAAGLGLGVLLVAGIKLFGKKKRGAKGRRR